jgi:predicted transcriptional regulator
VKGAVIEVLGQEWPLNLKQIHFELTKHEEMKCSYQAVHKALNRLVEENIVTKENKKYALDIEWVKKVSQFGRQTEKAYTKRQTGAEQIATTNTGTQKNIQWPS